MSHTFDYVQLLNEARPSWIKPIPPKNVDRGSYDQLAKAINTSTTANGVTYTSDGLVECNYSQLGRALNVLDKMPTKRKMGYSAIIYGEAGIGKSAVVEARAQAMAGELGREFITKDQFINKFQTIQEVMKNLKDYYIFMDERVASMDPSMMSGIPDPTSPEKRGYLTEMPLPWVALMTMSDDAAGFLFLDELNMADEEVQKALYSLLNFEERRIAGQYLIKGDWRIHSAGNWGEGYNSNPLRLALKERLAPILLKVDFEGWADWARTAKNTNGDPIIHPVLMDFIEEDPTANFYDRPSEEHEATKRPNPRNLVALSAAIYTVLGQDAANASKDTWNDLIAQASVICGKKFGQDFQQFLISNAVIDVADIFSRPEQLVDTSGTNESEIIQKISVFKRNFVKFVTTFDDKFNAAGEDAKADLVNLALNYIYVIDSIFAIEPATAATIFTPVVSKKTAPDFNIMSGTLSSYLKAQGNTEAVQYLAKLFKSIIAEVGGNAGAFMGKTPTAFVTTAEENEEGTEVNPKSTAKIASILDEFEQNLNSGNLTEFI
jgi:hypothetical protein